MQDQSMHLSFRGNMIAKGPTIKTMVQSPVAVVDPLTLLPFRAACTCEYCRTSCSPNLPIRAFHQEGHR
jgi:hypothetical protein